mgnify:CR=1 FL=1
MLYRLALVGWVEELASLVRSLLHAIVIVVVRYGLTKQIRAVYIVLSNRTITNSFNVK